MHVFGCACMTNTKCYLHHQAPLGHLQNKAKGHSQETKAEGYGGGLTW